MIAMTPLITPDVPLPDMRSRIVEEAERLFREIGYQKTTVSDIAKALKMSPANVYRFFDSKRAINEAVAERCTGAIGAAAEAIAGADKPAATRVRELLTMMNRMVMELGISESKMRDMVEVAMVESWGVIQAHIDQIDRVLTALVREGVAAGEFTADPEVAGACARAAMVRFWHPAMLVQCAEMTSPTLDQQIDFVLAALGHRPARAELRRLPAGETACTTG